MHSSTYVRRQCSRFFLVFATFSFSKLPLKKLQMKITKYDEYGTVSSTYHGTQNEYENSINPASLGKLNLFAELLMEIWKQFHFNPLALFDTGYLRRRTLLPVITYLSFFTVHCTLSFFKIIATSNVIREMLPRTEFSSVK